jgi:extracellular factor (EF) 3-hydroxypalmitic acid methyl ester biosynthesis protein
MRVQVRKLILPNKMATQNAETPETNGTLVTFRTGEGAEVSGALLRVTRFSVVCEAYNPNSVLRVSETLTEFKITFGGKSVYYGRAVITSLINAGTLLMIEVKLEDAWQDLHAFLPELEGPALCNAFREFLNKWHKIYKISPEYKATVSDMQMFLTDTRLWLDQVELGVRSLPSGDRIRKEQELALAVGDITTRTIGELFSRFEAITEEVEKQCPEQAATHSAFAKRLLHPLLLCAPFLYRSFRKPLGYAGDYELVNMICRDPLEGSTLFAKILNLWFLKQPPAEAHRNRIEYLVERITQATLVAARQNRTARILSLGCGPAQEVQRFIASGDLAQKAEFTLIDFDQETVEYTRATLQSIMHRNNRRIPIHVVRKSVTQILKESGRSVERSNDNQYDLVYCAGLFDYLPDHICRRISTVLHDWVAPGGVFISTNVDQSNPRRLTMNYIMDWHLIYRDGSQLAALRPEGAVQANEMVISDFTGVNLYYSVSKPNGQTRLH